MTFHFKRSPSESKEDSRLNLKAPTKSDLKTYPSPSTLGAFGSARLGVPSLRRNPFGLHGSSSRILPHHFALSIHQESGAIVAPDRRLPPREGLKEGAEFNVALTNYLAQCPSGEGPADFRAWRPEHTKQEALLHRFARVPPGKRRTRTEIRELIRYPARRRYLCRAHECLPPLVFAPRPARFWRNRSDNNNFALSSSARRELLSPLPARLIK
jgi:hypothetical protein